MHGKYDRDRADSENALRRSFRGPFRTHGVTKGWRAPRVNQRKQKEVSQCTLAACINSTLPPSPLFFFFFLPHWPACHWSFRRSTWAANFPIIATWRPQNPMAPNGPGTQRGPRAAAGPRGPSVRPPTPSQKVKQGDQLTSWSGVRNGAAFRKRVGADWADAGRAPGPNARDRRRLRGHRGPRRPPTEQLESWHQYVWGRRTAAPGPNWAVGPQNYLLRSGTSWWCHFPLRRPAASFWNRAFRGTDTSPYPSQPPSLTAATAFQSGGVRRGGRGEHIAYFTGDWCLYCLL